jgi:hypothetical protein
VAVEAVELVQRLVEEVRLVAALVAEVQETIVVQELLALQILAVVEAVLAGTVADQIQDLQVVQALLLFLILAHKEDLAAQLHRQVEIPFTHLIHLVVLRLNLRRNHGPFCKSSRRRGYSGNRC